MYIIFPHPYLSAETPLHQALPGPWAPLVQKLWATALAGHVHEGCMDSSGRNSQHGDQTTDLNRTELNVIK